MWVEFVVGSLREVFLRALWLSPLLKNQPTKNQVDEEPLSRCATSKSLFIYFTFNDKKEIFKKDWKVKKLGNTEYLTNLKIWMNTSFSSLHKENFVT